MWWSLPEPVRRRSLLLALVGGALGLPALAGCAPARPPLPPPLPAPPLHLAPVTDLVAAGGLEWLLLARPAELLRASSLGKPLAGLLPAANFDALAGHLGLDVRLADVLVAASYGASSLYLVQGAHDGALVEKQFTEGLTSSPERVIDASNLTRLSGTLGTTRRAMADLEQTVAAFEVGPSGPLRAAAAFAQGKLKRAKPALRAEPLLTLAARLGDAPILFYLPSPASSPWKQGAHGLLGRAVAVGLSATPSPEGLRLRAVALGAWDDPPTEALKRLELTVRDVVQSPLGHLLGLREPLVPFSSGGDRDAIHIEGVVDAEKMTEGLRAATSAELTELFPVKR